MYPERTPTRGGRVSLSAVQGYRDESGRNRQRTYETFGFVDELEGEFDDPVAHFRKVVAAMDVERRAREAPATTGAHPPGRVDKRASGRPGRHVGDALACWWLDALGVEAAIRNATRGRRVGYDPDAAPGLLVCERLVDPGPELAAHPDRDRHFFRSELTDDDACRAPAELDRVSGRIVGARDRAIARNAGRDESLACYDVTNYFFECDPDEGGGPGRKGVSKEHRPSPIARMGLLPRDAGGVPISYDLFAGNTSDCAALLPVLGRRGERGLGRVVVVADRGTDCSGNIAGCVAGGDGFVFSQSVRGTRSDSEPGRWAPGPSGYPGDPDGGSGAKSSQRHERVRPGDVDTLDGRRRDVDVEAEVVAMRGGKRAERARHERERVLGKSRQLAGRPGAHARATHLGAARYVRGVSFDRGTGEVLADSATKPEPGGEAIAAAAALDGYYLIVTSETDWPDRRILDAYRELWRIEESLGAAKTGGLDSRPVWVRADSHIRAHFPACYLALLIVRPAQRALPSHPSAKALPGDMRALDCSYADGGWWLFDHRSDLTDEVFALVGEEAPRKWMRTRDIKALFKKGKRIRWAETPHEKHSTR